MRQAAEADERHDILFVGPHAVPRPEHRPYKQLKSCREVASVPPGYQVIVAIELNIMMIRENPAGNRIILSAAGAASVLCDFSIPEAWIRGETGAVLRRFR